ncbi:porin [Marinobacterium jannaschii]|uniref:porin n=1 Tax=Marinobacterium jannaschii TaxID=64970 RepID=UPI00048980B4|nr:hypothetical protein [Marinobacterium jannaschii]
MKNKFVVTSIAIAVSSVLSSAAYAAGSAQQDIQREISQLKMEMEQLKASQGKGTAAKNTGPKKTHVEISGHINRAVQYLSDGSDSSVNSVDNDNSATRLRVIAEKTLNNDLMVGGALEVQLESNSTASINQNNEESGDGSQSFSDRRAEVYVRHENLGKLWLGQGWTASDGTAENDLSNTWLASGAYVGGAAGALFRRSDGVLDTDKIGSLGANLDGLGRTDRIRYDTPFFGGLGFATSTTQGGAWDVAARYGLTNEDLKLRASLGYADASGNDDKDWDSTTSGSVAVKLANGLNGSVSISSRSVKAGSALAAAGADPKHFYTKLGYQTNLVPYGKTSFSVDYRKNQDMLRANDELTGYGIQAVQSIAEYDTDVYFGVNRYERNRAGVDYEPVTVALLGARVKF